MKKFFCILFCSFLLSFSFCFSCFAASIDSAPSGLSVILKYKQVNNNVSAFACSDSNALTCYTKIGSKFCVGLFSTSSFRGCYWEPTQGGFWTDVINSTSAKWGKFYLLYYITDSILPSDPSVFDSVTVDNDFASFDDFYKFMESWSPVVDKLDSSLGSFVMASGQNSWANNFYGTAISSTKGVFSSRVQKVTSSGKIGGVDFDSYQYFCGLGDVKRQGVFPKSLGTFVDSEVHNGSNLVSGRGGFVIDCKYPDDFASSLKQFAIAADLSPSDTIQDFFSVLIGQNYSFKPIVFLRPYDSKSGAYGDWVRVTAGAVSSSTMNSSGTGSSVSGSSSEDPNSTSFSQNSDPVATTGTTASGTTLDNAINNAITFSPVVNVNPDINVNVNNNVSNELQQIQNASSSTGGQVTGGILSNIVGLLGLVGAVPQMLTVLFSWLPAWSLAVVGVAFALFVPVIIFKLLK